MLVRLVMVNGFDSAAFEIVLLARMESPLAPTGQTGELPKMLLSWGHRRCEPVLVVEIKFRAIPERTQAGTYAYRGRAELQFTSYALTEAEIMILRRELRRNEWGEVLGLLETNLTGNLNRLLGDLDELLVESTAAPAPKQTKPTNDPNPFTALFDFGGWFRQAEKPVPEEIIEPLKPDTEPEAVIRSLNLLEARQRCLEIYERSKETFKLPQF